MVSNQIGAIYKLGVEFSLAKFITSVSISKTEFEKGSLGYLAGSLAHSFVALLGETHVAHELNIQTCKTHK